MIDFKSWHKGIKFLVITGIVTTLVNFGALTYPITVRAQDSNENVATQKLSPEVENFIANNYLAHDAQWPDPNETVEVLKLYLEGEQALQEGRIKDAVNTFEKAIKQFPESRHAHEGYAKAFMEEYRSTKKSSALKIAADEYFTAAEIALKNGKVKYTDQIVFVLGETKDSKRFETFFEKVFTHFPDDYLATLDYAKGLALLNDSKAEETFKKAIKLRPPGNAQAIVDLGEYLIDQGRYEDALDNLVLQPGERLTYTHLLKGFSMEKLGRLEEAKKEYAEYASFSKDFPAPKKYKTNISTEEGVVFQGDVTVQDICTDMMSNFSKMIYCESRGEGTGGMRAVGWTARTRVFKGTSSDSCLSFINNSGSSLCYQYNNVITQPSQFCVGTTKDATTDQIASDVFYGYAPDPVNSWCPSGSTITNACTSTCSTSSYNGAHSLGPIWFYSTSSTCPSTHPGAGTCSTNRGKTCGNGGYDNCFYRRS